MSPLNAPGSTATPSVSRYVAGVEKVLAASGLRHELTAMGTIIEGDLDRILAVVRAHWRIENESNLPLDVQWREDHGVWCTTGASAYVLGLIRLIACNLVMHLRLRHLRPPWASRRWSPPPWRRLFAALALALTSNWLPELNATPVA